MSRDVKKEVLKKIEEDLTLIEDILLELGSEVPTIDNQGNYLFTAVCHHCDEEGKKKLHFYTDSLIFNCYTTCGTMDIFTLIEHHFGIDFQKALIWLCKFLKIDYNQRGRMDLSKWKKILKKKDTRRELDKWDSFLNKKSKEPQVIPIDKNLLNGFIPYTFHESWVNEGIDEEIMIHHNIRYDIETYRAIIPHFYYDESLLGIKCRNFHQEEVDRGRKYIFVSVNNNTCRYATSLNLWGLDKNKYFIEKIQTAFLFESEKSVMKYGSWYGKNCNNSLATMSTTLTNYQVDLLKKFQVQQVYLAWDKEFDFKWIENKEEYKKEIRKFNLFFNKLCKAIKKLRRANIKVHVMWDFNNNLELKDAPVDKTKEVFESMIEDSYYVTSIKDFEDYFNKLIGKEGKTNE